MPKESVRIPFYDQGLRFSCARCSVCCRFESGFVFLSEKDISLLISALNTNYEEFTETYCRWIPAENGELKLSLKEKTNYDCVFWASRPAEGCMVYDARPLQCRAFPFWASIVDDVNNWEEAAQDCPGMGKGMLYSKGAIQNWLSMREKEPIIIRTLRGVS